MGSLGYLTVWPSGQSSRVSTLNALTGTVVANAAIVPAGTDGESARIASNDTDLVIDINGYFAPPGRGAVAVSGGALPGAGHTSRRGQRAPFSWRAYGGRGGSVCAPPSTAQAYVFNATVVPRVRWAI